MNTPYSPHKILGHLDRLSDLQAGRRPPPIHLHLVLSDLCNQDCGFCAYRISSFKPRTMFAVYETKQHHLYMTRNHNPNRMIPTERAIEILDDFCWLGGRAVQFTGGGEPTVHPDHPRIIEYALNRFLDVALVTNGMRTDDVIDLVPRMRWVRVSLDAGYEKTYAETRRTSPANFPKVLNHIRQMRAAIDTAQSECVLGVSYIATVENWREIREGVQAARDAGAMNIRIGPMFGQDVRAYYDGIYEDVYAAVEAAREEFTTPEFTVYSTFSPTVDRVIYGAPDYTFCGIQYFTLYIGGDQNLYRCCTTSYSERGLICSLKEQRLRDAWATQEMRDAYKNFSASACTHCQFNDKNRMINAVLAAKDVHGTFV